MFHFKYKDIYNVVFFSENSKYKEAMSWDSCFEDMFGWRASLVKKGNERWYKHRFDQPLFTTRKQLK